MNQLDKKMLVILDCCVGCHACEIACRQEHDLSYETGSKWCRVMTIKPRKVQGKLHLDYFPSMCVQCEDPFCLEICPKEAIAKRVDGLVVVKGEKCNGCKLCIYVCPYGAMFYNETTQVAGKCCFCLERLAYGIEPSCVQHCIGGALQFVSDDDLERITQGKHAVTYGKVTYASSKWSLVSYLQKRPP